MPIFTGDMEDVGEGMNTSRVALPKSDIPPTLSRDVLIQHLVEEMHRRPGGTFDQWAELHGPVWDERVVQGLSSEDAPYTASTGDEERYVAEAEENYPY